MRSEQLKDLNAGLSREEYRVIVEKGTERPFSGKYVDHSASGTYTCRRCGAPLYESGSKFSSHCGWPSFDDEIAGAVQRVPDADGLRTEIVCNSCNAHLGHVFEGEGFTEKDVRHCVNSVSLQFRAEPEAAETDRERAVFAGGCFWGVEHYLKNAPGVLLTSVGYIGGTTQQPTYEQVCNGVGGHAEAVEVTFDPAIIGFEELAKLFFEIHDPTQLNRQGPDIGRQYRSALYYTSEEQRSVAETLIETLKARGFSPVTHLEPAVTFWPAEDYHQDYYARTGGLPYCHQRVKRFGDR